MKNKFLFGISVLLIMATTTATIATPATNVNASSEETAAEDTHGRFCDANPNDFSCSQEDRDQSNGDGIVGGVDDESDENSDNDNFDESSGCYKAGYDDGQNRAFDKSVYNDNCTGEGKYLDGFIDGCENADNTKSVCESATDK
jgi:hypothetical protein